MTRRTLLILIAIGLVTAGLGARQQDRLTADVLKGLPLRSIGPITRHRAHRRHRDRSEEPQHLVRRVGVRRPVEDRQSRHHVHADLRRRRRRSRCAASSSIRRTRTSSGSAPARTTASAARTSATASTSRPTPARPGSASGLENSEHIGKILDRSAQLERRLRRGAGAAVLRRAASAASTRRPTAAPRGTRVLHVSDDTGISDIVFDPKNPDVIYRRHLSAPAARRPDDRRRTRRRHLQDRRTPARTGRS